MTARVTMSTQGECSGDAPSEEARQAQALPGHQTAGTEDCRTLGPSSIEQLVPQARCALLAAARLLDALAAAGIYDQTELLLVADHGIGVENPAVPTASAREREWARRARCGVSSGTPRRGG
jgi:hypothetical protein